MASRMQVPPNSDLTLGMTCVDKATPGRCVWRMKADERFANPAGIMQGGFLGAFADSAMGAAAVTYAEGPQGLLLQRRDEDQLPRRGEPGCASSSARPRSSRAAAASPSSRRACWPVSRASRAPNSWWPGRRRPTSSRSGSDRHAVSGLLRCVGPGTRIVRHMTPRSDNGSHGLRHAGDDAFQLTVDYVKQETVEPLKGLGRFLYMGIAGSFFLAFGLLLILLGVLRLLQTETGDDVDRRLVLGALRCGLRARAGRDRRGRLADHRRTGTSEAARGRGTTRSTRARDSGGSELMAGTTTKAGSNGRLITRDDLQAAYAQVMGEGEATVRAAAPRGLAVAGAFAIVVIALAFLAGRRRGRARSAVVEIRRL